MATYGIPYLDEEDEFSAALADTSGLSSPPPPPSEAPAVDKAAAIRKLRAEVQAKPFELPEEFNDANVSKARDEDSRRKAWSNASDSLYAAAMRRPVQYLDRGPGKADQLLARRKSYIEGLGFQQSQEDRAKKQAAEADSNDPASASAVSIRALIARTLPGVEKQFGGAWEQMPKSRLLELFPMFKEAADADEKRSALTEKNRAAGEKLAAEKEEIARLRGTLVQLYGKDLEKRGIDPGSLETMGKEGLDALRTSMEGDKNRAAGFSNQLALTNYANRLHDADVLAKEGRDAAQKKQVQVQEVEEYAGNIRNETAKLKELVKKHGTFSPTGPASGEMEQAITNIATSMAKLADPGSVARDSEVATYKKMLFEPNTLRSLLTRDQTALDLISNLEGGVADRVKNAYRVRHLEQPETAGTKPPGGKPSPGPGWVRGTYEGRPGWMNNSTHEFEAD